ncbi:MAG: DUF192 domain-containing protein [Bdellovibrionota bacterium]
MFKTMVVARLQKNNAVISDHVIQADTFGKRLKGLIGYKQLPPNHSILIKPCKSIHTFFMRFPIDVLFLSDQNDVIAMYKALQPYRITATVRKACAVLETNAGVIITHQISLGDQLRFEI